MSETKTFEVTLPIELARLVEARVQSGEYESVSDLVRDSLEDPVGNDAEIERWLREEVVPTIDALKDGWTRVLSAEETRRQIDAHIAYRQRASQKRR